MCGLMMKPVAKVKVPPPPPDAPEPAPPEPPVNVAAPIAIILPFALIEPPWPPSAGTGCANVATAVASCHRQVVIGGERAADIDTAAVAAC